MKAFALEELNQLKDGRAFRQRPGRLSFENRRSVGSARPGACDAGRRARIEEGVAFLEPRQAKLDGNSTPSCSPIWNGILALFYLSQGRT